MSDKIAKPAKPAKPVTEKKERKKYVLPVLTTDQQAVYSALTAKAGALVNEIAESVLPAMHVRDFVKVFNTTLKKQLKTRTSNQNPVDKKREKLQAKLAKIQAEIGSLPANAVNETK
jgi:flagellar biosynthesis chaperone FliJ